MFGGLVQKVLDKSRKPQTRQHLIVSLVLDEAFFLLITPWFLILPAAVISRWIPMTFRPEIETGVGLAAALSGLSYSLWAVRCQWRQGGGTPSLNAPTQHLVVAGPYRLARNPIQLGTSMYILGLGALTFSLLTGVIAGATALLVGVIYIKLVEEKELRIRFGEEYEAYRRQTPLLIPFGRFPTTAQRSLSNPMDTKNSEGDAERLPNSLPTKGRVLVHAAHVYDQVQPFVTLGQEARMNRWIAERLAPSEGMRVLDVGCGTGLLTVQIAESAPGCTAEGIDASGPMIQVARRKRTRPNCSFKQALAEELPYPDGHFDIVTSALFFHHVNRELKRRCLQEILRTLKPGGRLVIADMDRPYTVMGWLLSYGAWILFRQPEIKENIDGVLRTEVVEAGFTGIADLGRFSGYIAVFSAHKPE